VVLVNHGTETVHLAAGDRVAQLLIQRVEEAAFARAEELADSDRGQAGFGSTGR
jgi:dUTP pyrophosphatase